MSSSNRTASKGGKGPKADKSHKNDKTDSGKHTNEHKPASGGGGDNARSKSDDPNAMKERIHQVMEVTHKSEEDACLALHECDNDVERAADMLLDDDWGIIVKKKKNRQASSSKQENADNSATAAGAVDDWNDQSHPGDKEKPRNKSGGPPRLHGRHNDSRGWRGREKQENERNLEDGGRYNQEHRDRRGRPGGPTRGGGGRGRGGGRAGGRFPPRNNRNTFSSRPMETWDNSNTWDANTAVNHTENWDDGPIDEWSTEEYTGSLADTKVFTPSVQPELSKEADNALPVRSPLPEERNQMSMQQGHVPSQSPVPPMVGTLNAAQTQYFSQLTQQNSDLKASHIPTQTYGNPPTQQQAAVQQYSTTTQYGSGHSNAYASSGYPVVNAANYGSIPETQPAQQPVRKTQRARVPPPSKIPSSAVEMPGDLKSIGLLDVQFGAMDLISDNMSFDSVADTKFNSANSAKLDNANTTPSANLDLSNPNQNSTIDAYSSQQKTNTSSISPALSQSLNSSETIPQTSEHLPAGYNTTTRTAMTGTSSGTASTIDLNKQSEPHSYSQSSTYISYQPKSSSYQPQNYSSSSYSTTQTTSSYVSNQPNNYVSNNSGSTYNTPSGTNAYQNAYSSSNSYQSNTASAGFPPSMSQANSYPGTNQAYPQNTSQSVYGTNAGLNSNSNYGNTTSSTPQYNSYNSTANHKLVKDNTYDNSTTVVSSTATPTTSVSTAASTLALSQTTTTGTKATTTLAKNSSGVVSNIPPGVAPVMSTPYIMSQIPYFQQPMYTYEEMQILQQRLPHMTTPYYEMSYQTPTTLTAVRDQPLATYSMSDARFTRGDNNASPVPSTLSQQTSTLTQGHQAQPILTQTAGPYFFAAPYNPMQSYQFGAVYSQIPTATNAHGASNSTQYPKPSTYGSGYGSGYDALGQSQDYSKGGYVGNTQGQTKGTGANASSTGTTGNDLSAMYGKSHTAIGKVNSYEKQGFHSGTPPPFSGALHGSQNAGLAPSGSGYGPQMYIPTMPPHQQHHSTQMMPLHQDSGNTSGQRSQSTNQTKSGAKQYPNTYWNQA
ncbi:Ubiquitin-associated protein 2 [Popillia japonica]|uniref:Ubiquitin-associated protein 2 n=1 Tax=Popillia japonica TaxID=7064 RepID=A0AAW1IUL2_POPJA